jgi:hypothetical protein
LTLIKSLRRLPLPRVSSRDRATRLRFRAATEG